MTLEQIARKYGINPNSLNAKDDSIKIAVKSIKELVTEMEKRNENKQLINALKKLGEFLYDVSDSKI